MATTTLRIGGMLSVHSVRAVYTALASVEGIISADVSLGKAIVEHDGRATPALLSDAIASVGCEVAEYTEERRRLPLL
jgi:copper chaperone CopZ